MDAVDTVARLLTLVPWLLERPGATVSETAKAFGVDRRTVLADLDTIGYCGLPGLGGGDLFEVTVLEDRILVRMADELRQPLRLNPREALRLILAGEAASAALGEELAALRSALSAIKSAAGIPPGVTVELDEDGSKWLPGLRGALESSRRVRLRYRGRGDAEAKERTVDPWTLHVTEGAWYLQGRDDRSGEARTFRLDRIAELEVLEEPAAPAPREASLRSPHYEPGPDDVEVELVLSPEVRWVADKVRPDAVEDLPEGQRRVAFHTDALAWVLRLVLGAGPGVKVTRPPELAAEVAAAARAALRRYGH
ncbi:MAG: WYL domain-containing protein [Actinomycetota bacterium]|nr:WYL domain-containing protein [Actinomycetota bacterium]